MQVSWRQCFVDALQPSRLPQGWSVEHAASSLHPATSTEAGAWHGVHEETLAAHVSGGPDAATAGRREWSRLRRFGLPPREPALVLVESVLSRLV